jgi:hypothetical protein
LRKDYSPDSYEFVLKYIYGFRFEDDDDYALPHTLYKLAEVAQIAKLWEVNGLLWLVTDAADRFLVESLGNEYKLQEFLYIQTWERLCYLSVGSQGPCKAPRRAQQVPIFSQDDRKKARSGDQGRLSCGISSGTVSEPLE